MATIDGLAGDDNLQDQAGDDILNGFGGNDSFQMVNGGNDQVNGGAGDGDWVSYEGYSSAVVLNTSVGTVFDGIFTDTLIGIEGFHTSYFGDTITIDGTYVFARAGNDNITATNAHVIVGSGNDTVRGDENTIVSFFDDSFIWGTNVDGGGFITSGVVVNLATGNATDGWGGVDTLIGILNVEGSHLGDTITGNNRSNFLDGGAGNDTINGGGTATADNFDRLMGGDGNDTLTIVGAGAAIGGAGNDTIRFVSSGDIDIDYLEAGYWSAQRGIIANMTAGVRAGIAAGSASAGYSVRDGEGGIDKLFGVHRISDSEHGDTFFVGRTYVNSHGQLEISLAAGNDLVRGEAGAKIRVVYNTAEGAVEADLEEGYATDRDETDVFIGYDRLVNVTDLRGGRFGDWLAGTDGANQIRGRQGNDTIFGRGGNDRLYGDNRQNDGMTGNDTIDGGTGNDEIGGGNGNDRLIGGEGKDTLTGGAGVNRFIFNEDVIAANADVIVDFVSGRDKIELDNAVMSALGAKRATLNPAMYVENATGTASNASHRIIYETDTGRLLYDADGSGSAASVLIATLQGKPNIAASDFVVI